MLAFLLFSNITCQLFSHIKWPRWSSSLTMIHCHRKYAVQCGNARVSLRATVWQCLAISSQPCWGAGSGTNPHHQLCTRDPHSRKKLNTTFNIRGSSQSQLLTVGSSATGSLRLSLPTCLYLMYSFVTLHCRNVNVTSRSHSERSGFLLVLVVFLDPDTRAQMRTIQMTNP